MNRTTTRILAASLLTLCAALSGCGSDYDSPPPVGPPDPPPPPTEPPPVVFSEFVKEQFAATSDDTDPVAVDDTEFSFDDDPSAYDDLLTDP